MIWMLAELPLEVRGGAQCGSECLISRRLRGRQVEGGEDLRFVVLGEALRQRLEGLGQRFDACAVGTLREPVVVLRDRLDEGAFTLGLGPDRAPADYRLLRPLRARRCGARGEDIADQDARDSPCCDGAARI